MSSPATVRFLLCAAALLVAASLLSAQTAFDPKKLDARIDIKLVDASMADAAAALAKLADIEVAAPAEPKDGLTTDLKGQTAKTVIEMLAKMSGLSWYIEGNVIVFRRPLDIPTGEASEKPLDKLGPEEAMTEMLRTLSDFQLFRLSRGFPLTYAELMPFQQQVLKAMLSPTTTGLTSSGSVVRPLPAPEQVTLSLYVMPYLLIANPGANGMTILRLDSSPYVHLKKAGVE